MIKVFTHLSLSYIPTLKNFSGKSHKWVTIPVCFWVKRSVCVKNKLATFSEITFWPGSKQFYRQCSPDTGQYKPLYACTEHVLLICCTLLYFALGYVIFRDWKTTHLYNLCKFISVKKVKIGKKDISASPLSYQWCVTYCFCIVN